MGNPKSTLTILSDLLTCLCSDCCFAGLGLGDEEDSNCSSDEDQLLYTKAFDEDASFHGVAYARYKRNMLQQFYGDKEDDSDAESDDD